MLSLNQQTVKIRWDLLFQNKETFLNEPKTI